MKATQITIATITLLICWGAAGALGVDLHQRPKASPTNVPRLAPIFGTNGATITSTNQWLTRRQEIEAKWLKALGMEKPKRIAASDFRKHTKISDTEVLPTFTRQYVTYEVEKGVTTDGYLLTPKNASGKLPAIVVFHPTTPLQAKGVAGLSAEYAEEKRQAIQLVERGYIVWCPRNYIFDEVKGIPDGQKLYMANVARIHKLHPRSTGMARMVLDSIRAADFLESLPNVDTNRIGAIGHSLGGKQVLYAAAFDTRYKAVVSSEGGIGLSLSNWEAPWYLGEKIKAADWKLDHQEVLSLVAPRAFLLLAGDFADGDKSWAYLEAAEPVYKLFAATDNLGWFDHHLGHRYAPEARAVAEQFLDAHLNK